MRGYPLCLLALWMASCALPQSNQTNPRAPEVLRLENTSGDLLRVYFEIDDREVLVGRVEPFETRSFRIPPGIVNAGGGFARLLIVPLGAGRAVGAPNAAGIRSEAYRTMDFLQFQWRFTGTRIFMSMTGR